MKRILTILLAATSFSLAHAADSTCSSTTGTDASGVPCSTVINGKLGTTGTGVNTGNTVVNPNVKSGTGTPGAGTPTTTGITTGSEKSNTGANGSSSGGIK